MYAPLFRYLKESHQILQFCLKHIDNGEYYFYRVCALQLRLLLCDTTFRHNQIEDISLVNKVNKEMRFHQLDDDGTFTPSLEKIPLNEWLDQILPEQNDPNITIRQLIRSVCDQDGGAHVDQKSNAGVHKINSREKWIYCVSQYIEKELCTYISQAL